MKTIVVLVLLVLTCGCQQGLGLRWEPTENIKESAELTNDLARKVNNEGTEPKSPAGQKLVQGTQALLSYVGRPRVTPDPEQFETVTIQAQADAAQRPDAFQLIDSTLDLAIAIGLLLPTGGAAGIGVSKVIKFAKTAKEKSTALKEIIQGNELFKETAAPEVKQAFAAAQDKKQVSNDTKLIVAAEKLI